MLKSKFNLTSTYIFFLTFNVRPSVVSYAAKKYLKRDKTFKTRKLSLMSEKFMRQNFRCKSALLGGRRGIL